MLEDKASHQLQTVCAMFQVFHPNCYNYMLIVELHPIKNICCSKFALSNEDGIVDQNKSG